jgi:hypothetical protein
MTRKSSFAQSVRADATGLVRAIGRVEALSRILSSEGYDSAGADPLIQADLTGTDTEELDVADIQAFLYDMVPTLTTWLDSNNRRATLDRLIEVINL